MTNTLSSALYQFDSEAKFQTLLETASIAIVIINTTAGLLTKLPSLSKMRVCPA